MIDIKKHIDYWKKTAEDDVETATILFAKGKIKEGLFWCHLLIEKMLKANFVKYNRETAPKTHNLAYLTRKSNLKIPDEFFDFIAILQNYQLEGRYPEYEVPVPPLKESEELFLKTKGLYQWLLSQL